MKALVGVAALLLAASAQAEGLNMYAGGGIGQSTASDFCADFSGFSNVSCDDKSTSIKGFFGYQLNRNIAFEAAVNGFGESKARGPGGTATANSVAIEGDVVASLPLGSQFSLYGKVGIYSAYTEVDVNTTTLVGTFDDNNVDITYGFGGRWDFAERWAGRVEWQQYKSVGGTDTGETDIDVINVAVMYKF
jgi:OOP family OmpA-OmpF porin